MSSEIVPTQAATTASLTRRAAITLGSCTVVAASHILTRHLLLGTARPPSPSTTGLAQGITSGDPNDASGELRLHFLGSSSCGFSTAESMRPILHAASRVVRAEALSRGLRSVVMGIALDKTLRDGVNYLSALGHFDEISVGGGWQNVMAGDLLFARFGGRLATPQLLVVERRFPEDAFGDVYDRVTLRYRAVGSREIQDWLRVDARIPRVQEL
jgi:hypothetical protein